MSNDRHFYLLAKGWYIRNEIKIDIATIQATYCGLDFECATVDELFIAGLDRLLMLVFDQLKDKKHLTRFITDAREKHRGYWGEPLDFDDSLAMACLSKLALAEIKDIPFELGLADYNLLPCKPYPRWMPTCFGI